jgi:hypothetical protein
MSEPLINVSFVDPPAPLERFSYCATLDGYSGEPSEPMGFGPTEAAAKADLLRTISDEAPETDA